MSRKQSHDGAAQLERRQFNKARRERKERIWNTALLVIAVLIIATVIAIQISHHI